MAREKRETCGENAEIKGQKFSYMCNSDGKWQYENENKTVSRAQTSWKSHGAIWGLIGQ